MNEFYNSRYYQFNVNMLKQTLKLKEIHEYWTDNNYSITNEEIDEIIKTK